MFVSLLPRFYGDIFFAPPEILKLSIFGDAAEIQRRERERECRLISFYFSVAWAAMKCALMRKLGIKKDQTSTNRFRLNDYMNKFTKGYKV